MAASSAMRLAKRIIDYPEETVPVITPQQWAQNSARDPKKHVINYLKSLFPILSWITRYNLGWLTGDVIAGLTVGLVVVPQGMSYALIATLPAQYGLYSSFVGVLIYCFFATSKDVSIGPVAVMSLTVSQVIKHVNKSHPNEWSNPEIATTLSFICGFIVLGIGLLRLGWLVEFIPAPAVSGFMTGSAISIAAGQVPGLMGISGFDTRAATYKVIINTLKGLPRTTIDAAFGLTGLLALYAIRAFCDYMSKRFPRRARLFFFISVLRNAFVLIVLTLAAWLYAKPRKDSKGKYPIKILLTVPRGFQHVGPPRIERELLTALAGELPVAVIILLLEHIAIAKSFGRLNGYTINPNQELIAIGVTNTIGSVFGAYPATGSFSRSALKSKSGVRTPAAGILTAVVVIIAIYALTAAFFWIPTAGLSAVIIHAVLDLPASPSQIYSYWRISPLEFLVFVIAVILTIFSSIENGIYASCGISLALLLIRIAHPRGSFLGKVTLHAGKGSSDPDSTREVFVPLKEGNTLNHGVKVVPPTPGVIVYRFEESYIYPNSSMVNSALVAHVKTKLRRGRDMTHVKLSDRPWNDPGPSRHGAASDHAVNSQLPILHAIVLDFSCMSHLDTTALQSLIDARTEIEKWADHPVEFHFATILSPWIHRALVAGGFGTGLTSSTHGHEITSVVAHHDGVRGRGFTDSDDNDSRDIEARDQKQKSYTNETASNRTTIMPEATPYFHVDLAAAVRAAESGIGRLSATSSLK